MFHQPSCIIQFLYVQYNRGTYVNVTRDVRYPGPRGRALQVYTPL
jgi:hypothetical protein